MHRPDFCTARYLQKELHDAEHPCPVMDCTTWLYLRLVVAKQPLLRMLAS